VETYFEITKLRELLAVIIETIEIRLRLIVNDLVGADVLALRESLLISFILVWTFFSVLSFVCLKFFVNQDGEIEIIFYTYLQVSKLRKTMVVARFFTWL
jgi:hypothetical protein